MVFVRHDWTMQLWASSRSDSNRTDPALQNNRVVFGRYPLHGRAAMGTAGGAGVSCCSITCLRTTVAVAALTILVSSLQAASVRAIYVSPNGLVLDGRVIAELEGTDVLEGLATLMARATALEARLNASDTLNAALAARLNASEARVAELSTRLNATEQAASALASRVTATETADAALAARVDGRVVVRLKLADDFHPAYNAVTTWGVFPFVRRPRASRRHGQRQRNGRMRSH
jgi:hypothetical protein